MKVPPPWLQDYPLAFAGLNSTVSYSAEASLHSLTTAAGLGNQGCLVIGFALRATSVEELHIGTSDIPPLIDGPDRDYVAAENQISDEVANSLVDSLPQSITVLSMRGLAMS